MVKVSKEVLKIKNNWQRSREYCKIKKIDQNQNLAKVVDNKISLKIDLNQDLTEAVDNKINLKKVMAIKISKKGDHNHKKEDKKREVEAEIKEALVSGLKRLIKKPNKLISNLSVVDNQI